MEWNAKCAFYFLYVRNSVFPLLSPNSLDQFLVFFSVEYIKLKPGFHKRRKYKRKQSVSFVLTKVLMISTLLSLRTLLVRYACVASESQAYSAKRATVSTRQRFLSLFWHFLIEGRGFSDSLKFTRERDLRLPRRSWTTIEWIFKKFVKNLGLVETVARFAL